VKVNSGLDTPISVKITFDSPYVDPLGNAWAGAGTKTRKTPLRSATCIAAGRSAKPAAVILRAFQRLDTPYGTTVLWRRRQIRRDGVCGAHCVFPYK